jgi:hypothetical protein
MPDSTFGKPGPQFSTAEYETPPGIDACKFCRQPVGEQYYRIKSAMVCSACVSKLQGSRMQDSHPAFVRALIFGIAGAIVGLILYATVEIATGIIIGYMSLGVGFLVAKAMMVGSKGTGGRRYQITAAVLTYAAVSMAAIPVALVPMIRNHSQQQKQHQASPSQQNPQQQTTETEDTTEKTSFAKALGVLALIGLASPFLELFDSPFHGLIGLVILLVGIQIAWRMTAGKQLDIFGPFQSAPQKVP